MTDKFDEYSDILSRLVDETVACTPEEWDHGTLTIESDGVRINYKLKSPDQPGSARISENLRDLIDELYVRMDRHGEAWRQATIQFRLEGVELKFDTSFEYAANLPPVVLPPKQPWWKFGRRT
jgi:hypothetical protein